MMAAGAFSQAQSSLRWFIDNFSAIADWRATLLRVANFRHAVSSAHEPRGFESRIAYTEGEPGDDLDRGSGDRIRRECRHAQGNQGGREERGARAHSGRAGNRQDAAVSGVGGPVAVGRGPHHAPRGRADILPAARHALHAPRNLARGPRLSLEGRELRRDCFHARAVPAGARAAGAAARCDPPLGPGIEPGRAALPRRRAHPAAEAALGAHRRHLRVCSTTTSSSWSSTSSPTSCSAAASSTSAAPPRRTPCSRAFCTWSRLRGYARTRRRKERGARKKRKSTMNGTPIPAGSSSLRRMANCLAALVSWRYRRHGPPRRLSIFARPRPWRIRRPPRPCAIWPRG